MGLLRDFASLTKARQVSERVPVTIGALSGGGGISVAPVSLLGSTGTSGWLFAVIDRIATAVASVQWRLYRTLPNGERREVLSHPAIDIMQTPNPFTNRQEFLELTSQHFDLVGEAWWVVLSNRMGTPVELQILRPDRMRVIPSRDAYIAGYQYRLGTEVIPLETSEVIFIRRPSPLDPYRGIGAVQSFLVDLGSEQMAAQWSRAFFSNDATPGGIIELDDAEMDDTQFERYIARWRSQHQGVGNAHRVAVLEKGKWVDRKLTQRDMQFEQLRKFSRDVILGAFGIHGSILGISENVNRANAEAAEVHFARWIVRPRCARMKAALNTRLLPLFGDKALEFDFENPVPEDRALLLEEADRGYRGGYLTQNEARSRVGEPAVPDGDAFFEAPMTLAMPDGRILRRAAELPAPGEALSRTALRKRIEEVLAERWEDRLGSEQRRILDHIEANWPDNA